MDLAGRLARLGTGCRLKVSDFHQDGEEATIRLHEKGDKRRTVGLRYAAAEAITEYLHLAGTESGPLFRHRRNSRSEELANRPIDEVTMWRAVLGYLERLPGSAKEVSLADSATRRECIYTPHSLQANTACQVI